MESKTIMFATAAPFMGSTENSQYMNTKLHVKLTFCLRLIEID